MTTEAIMNSEVPAEIEALSDGWLVFELTGDASFLSDEEILAELGL